MPTKITILVSALLLALNLSAAVERHALVIGNANYQSSPLRNPLNDARDMAAALKGLGFQVQSLLDADAGQMKQVILDFGDRLRTGGVGLFYYAVYGTQAQGKLKFRYRRFSSSLVFIGLGLETTRCLHAPRKCPYGRFLLSIAWRFRSR